MSMSRERTHIEELHTLAELCELVRRSGDLYVRYSKGPDDDRGRVSCDYESGLELPGLSVDPLSSEPWWTRPLEDWVSRQLCHYVHLQENAEYRCAWVLTGTVAGFGPDREPLLADWEPVALLADSVIEEARAHYHAHFDVGRDSTD